jgi:hypothetical protein
MDPTRFDMFTRTLSRQSGPLSTRRALLAVVGAGLAGLSVVGSRETEAKKKKRKRRHRRRGGKKGGGGSGGVACPPPCPSNKVCVNGTCVAAPDVCAGPTGICNAQPTPCGTSETGETCGCERSVEGNTVCIDGADPCPIAVECISSQDCVEKLDIRYFCQEAKTNASQQFCGCGFGTATGRVCVARCDNPG